MKITIDVDVTPRELRGFFGLPDVKPLQDEMLERIQDKMRAGVEGFDVLNLMKPMLPPHMQSLDVMQKTFWKVFSGDKKASVVKTESGEDDGKKEGNDK
uniref:Uncharacterized protein n=1 Tax=Candidatus Kentrum eta TaxID=2126337 RepID=A0A450UMA8_9GAMM|nr:MAG: hypothetical protein BECKH772A_GA0070896_1004911 [Candidatus Kentron sp. H]VFJ93676.1 MAG: hypothetical protein BECKH772B_GA0070898_1004811 [Candidatus Kentron sp. H]VFK00624.1 MAG: hypothetical protein BECKH772C_GA0070978_1004911 [Candidatus Kentron sp. H]